MQTSCIKVVLSSSANHNNYHTAAPLGFLTTTTLVRLITLLQTYQLLGLDLPCWRTTVTGVQTLFQILLRCPQHLLLLLVREWQVLGVGAAITSSWFSSSSTYWSLCCNKKFCSQWRWLSGALPPSPPPSPSTAASRLRRHNGIQAKFFLRP
jgi:hypothetical protein